MRLADGVHAFPQTITRDGEDVQFHPAAVETDHGLLLVDVGFPGAVDQLEENLSAAGHGWADVWGVLLTHQDGDHASGLSAVVDRADPAVFAHPECVPYVDGRRDPIKGERYPPVSVDVEVPDGTTFDTAAGPMAVVHTPGHAPGHVSLYLPDPRLLLAGDALTAADGSLAPPSAEFTPDMEGAIDSVGTLADRDIERTLCYHGGLVEAGTGAIARIWTDATD